MIRNAIITCLWLPAFSAALSAQTPKQPQQPPDFRGGPPFGGPGQEDRKILNQFDKDANSRLDKTERAAAREFLKQNPAQNRGGPMGGRGRPGGPMGGPMQGETTAPQPGEKITPADVQPSAAPLYDPNTLRTLFFEFENADWEAELEAFHGTDVEVPAKLTADGKVYQGVGVRFRGMSSYMMVPSGRKRSFNVSVDYTEKKQRLGGVKTLNLLNCNGDGSFLSAALFSHLARKHLPAPRVNLVRVVVNGENWGIYANQEQFNKDFIKANYGTTEGARWKVRGSPGGRGGLEYLGDDPAPYRQRYEMKGGDDDDWHALIRLCKTLCQTPPDKLEAAIAPILNLDEALWFLTLDCGLINSDGYWTRASDYSIYRDPTGKFHVSPCDMNEAFREPEGMGMGGPGGPGGRGGWGGRGVQWPQDGDRREMRPGGDFPGGPQPPMGPDAQPPANGERPNIPTPPSGPGADNNADQRRINRPRPEGVKLDPLVGIDDETKPLRSKLLAVPALRERYLANVRKFASEDLAWETLGPVVASYRKLLEPEIAKDTRKNSTTEEFLKLTADTPATAQAEPAQPEPGAFRRGPGRGGMPIRSFADQRRAFLLEKPKTETSQTER